jgi:HAD superfamily hydrolase (TIGR01509 family)
MDGLLVDSEPLWTVAEEQLAAELGGVWSAELKASIIGTRLDVAVPAILGHYGHATEPVDVAWASSWLLARMVELFEAGPLVLPGVTDLIASVRSAGIPMALVSSSYRVLVDAVLRSGLGPFDLTLAGDEVVQGKPHPEPYLTAAAGLGAAPADCVVLEDSAAGVRAGEAAGCSVVAVPSVPGVAFVPSAQRLVLPSLVGVSVTDLQALVLRPTG